MIDRRPRHVLQGQKQHPVDRIRIGRRFRRQQLAIEVEVGIFRRQEFLQLADRRPLNCIAGDRAFEDVMGLVFRVDGQFKRETVVDVDVREDTALAVLDHLLAFQVVLAAFLFEQVANQGGAVAEDVQVDVGTFADVAGHHAADQPRPESAQEAHHAQRLQTHVAQIDGAAVAFVDAGEDLDLLADFGIGGKVFGFDPLTAEPFGRLAFRGEVFGFDALVHQAGRFESDGLTQFTLTHSFEAPLSGPSMRRGAGERNTCQFHCIDREHVAPSGKARLRIYSGSYRNTAETAVAPRKTGCATAVSAVFDSLREQTLSDRKSTLQPTQREIFSHPLTERPITFPSGFVRRGCLITLVRPGGLWSYGAAYWTSISATNGTD